MLINLQNAETQVFGNCQNCRITEIEEILKIPKMSTKNFGNPEKDKRVNYVNTY